MANEANHAEMNGAKWDSRAATYDSKRFDYFRYMQRRLISLLPLHEDLRFLDVGCGTGWAVRHVAELVNQRGVFCGVDLSFKMIERAKDHVRDLGRIHFCRASAEGLPFQDGLFDLVICTNSFHHYLHPAQAVEEFSRVLRPGGRVYIMDVSSDDPLTRAVDRVVKRTEPEHVGFHSTQEYRTFFASAGLRHVAASLILPPLKAQIGEKGLQRFDSDTAGRAYLG